MIVSKEFIRSKFMKYFFNLLLMPKGRLIIFRKLFAVIIVIALIVLIVVLHKIKAEWVAIN